MTRLDWQINIENYASRVAEEHDSNVVLSVFARYGATCFEDLSPSVYTEVFADLQMIAEDR